MTIVLALPGQKQAQGKLVLCDVFERRASIQNTAPFAGNDSSSFQGMEAVCINLFANGGGSGFLARAKLGYGGAASEFGADMHVFMLAVRVTKFDVAVDQGEEGVITPHADILARFDFGAALAHDDAPGANQLAVKAFNA